MYCKRCGNKLSEMGKFCRSCGHNSEIPVQGNPENSLLYEQQKENPYQRGSVTGAQRPDHTNFSGEAPGQAPNNMHQLAQKRQDKENCTLPYVLAATSIILYILCYLIRGFFFLLLPILAIDIAAVVFSIRDIDARRYSSVHALVISIIILIIQFVIFLT